MSTDIQSFLAIVIVLITAGFILYFAFKKKEPGCGGGCGCNNLPKKFSSPKKK